MTIDGESRLRMGFHELRGSDLRLQCISGRKHDTRILHGFKGVLVSDFYAGYDQSNVYSRNV